MTGRTYTIDVPGRVWHDALDPLASGMEMDLGLGRCDSQRIRRGHGFTVRYEGVPAQVARELADYLADRGETMLNQGVSDPYDPSEKADRDTQRASIRTAEQIRQITNEE